MPQPEDSRRQPGFANLIGGIVGDARLLIRQEMALARLETQQALHKAKLAAVTLAVGAGVAIVGVVMLCLMLVHLLHDLTVVDGREVLPLWGCYGIVGGLLATIAAGLYYLGARTAHEVHVVPPQTVATLKEMVHGSRDRTELSENGSAANGRAAPLH